MTAADKHFDVFALLEQVSATRVGLSVKTNHPAGFRRIVYRAMTERPDLRKRILQRSGDVFYIVNPAALSPTANLPEAVTVADLEDDL